MKLSRIVLSKALPHPAVKTVGNMGQHIYAAPEFEIETVGSVFIRVTKDGVSQLFGVARVDFANELEEPEQVKGKK